MALDFTKSNNAMNLKNIQKKSVENSNRIVAIDVPLSEIDKNEDNEKIFNMEEIEYLANGIKEDGFFGAIEVYKKPDGRYEISSGHRRYEAMKFLHRETIPCIVKELPDDFTRGKKLLTSNIRNRKLTPMDMARAIEYYEHLLKQNKEKGIFKDKAAEFFNISPAQVYRFQCLLKLIPELQELANDPQFPYSALREAAGLTEEGQKKLYTELVYFIDANKQGNEREDERELKLTRPRIEQLIQTIKDKEEYQARPNIVESQKKRKEKKEELDERILPNYITPNPEVSDAPFTEEKNEESEPVIESIEELESKADVFAEFTNLVERLAGLKTLPLSDMDEERKSKCRNCLNDILKKL